VRARQHFQALVEAAEGEVRLAEAALWIAAEEYPDLDVPGWLARLDVMGQAAARRITREMNVDDASAALNSFLFEEQGFRGNQTDYYDPRNSFLNEVLERRLGIPITLSVVYIEVAARAGVRVEGVGLPGHFVVRIERHRAARLLDPFNGGVPLTEVDCRALVEATHGTSMALDRHLLGPVTTGGILTRMLGNLKGIYLRDRDFPRALAAVERILLLRPGVLAEVRDRGTIHAKLGAASSAIRDWEAYLREASDAPDSAEIRRELRLLRQAQAVLN